MEVKARQRRSDVGPDRENKNKFGAKEGEVKNQEREEQTALSKSSKRIYVL